MSKPAAAAAEQAQIGSTARWNAVRSPRGFRGLRGVELVIIGAAVAFFALTAILGGGAALYVTGLLTSA